ncbi:MAG TPA: helix-turn-helix domain-containing protein [Phenylobacterium sp.]|nr:helix-turn-helix domain-containing protein [Phenylobacterium sp.]
MFAAQEPPTYTSIVQRTSFKDEECPIARALEHVGEWWSMLILRDAFQGRTRFDEFQKSLNIAPNMLTRRLRALVESGLLEPRTVGPGGRRRSYHLTARGHDFWPVLVALHDWSASHYQAPAPATRLVDRATGAPVETILVERSTGRPISQLTHRFAPAPGASPATRAYLGADPGPEAPGA